ncbi:MAG: glycine--tRNA ligase subunit beta [Sphingomicrobium sp.]
MGQSTSPRSPAASRPSPEGEGERFLLELRCEEIPARMQAGARKDLARLFAEEVERAGLSSGSVEVYSTPRRLALIARDLPLQTQARSEEIKGPRSSAPPQALEGFLRKTGLTRDQLKERDGVFFASVDTPGQATLNLLGPIIERVVRTFPWPKSMRWGEASSSMESLRWVRPLHGIVALFGEEIVPVAIDDIEAGAATLGHRFHHPGPITIGGAHDYSQKLRACHVIVDHNEREALIRDGAATAAADAGLSLVEDEGLVVENTGLTEWPVPLLGRFDAEHLDVPREVIVLTMRANQKYFACTGKMGALAPAFVCVANIDAEDGGANIVNGHKRVLAARLADARFFWEQDLKVPLEEQAAKLSGIVFHEKLGTLADKVERVAKLARWLVEEGIVKGADSDQAERAARLAKADLVTGMVGEFPELQGVIGGYLARAHGEPDAIADAVRDHYKPMGQGDDVPTAPVTVAVALADKLDTLVSFFAASERPTGSKDPFALRRAALSLLEIAIQNDVRLPIRFSTAEAYGNVVLPIITTSTVCDWDVEGRHQRITKVNFKGFTGRLAVLTARPVDWTPEEGEEESYTAGPNVDELVRFVIGDMTSVVESISNYLFDRLEERQRREGRRYDLVRAVLSKKIVEFTLPLFGRRTRMRLHDYKIDDDPVRLLARVKALQAFVETGEGTNLLAGYKRVANILKKEDWTAPQVMSSPDEQGIPQTGEEDPLVLVEEPGMAEAVAEMASGRAGADLPEERALIAALDEVEREASSAVEAEDFTAAMAALASLRAPIDAFFDKVTVNDPDAAKRERRLNLLLRFRDAVHRVADFSKIEG